MFTINFSNNIPDDTYFTSSDVSPEFNAETSTITLFDGKGTRRSWGAPQVNSTVIIEQPDFVAVHVGFSHKHRGGQQWYYFTAAGRRTWAQLTEAQQQLVLADWKSREGRKSPSWAKCPGTPKAEKKSPELTKRTAYKLVKMLDDDTMVSLYDNSAVYAIGKRMAEKAREDHNGGFYAYPTIEGMMKLWNDGDLVPARCTHGVTRLALLEVEISGTIISYGSKIAATYLRPVKVVEVIQTAQA